MLKVPEDFEKNIVLVIWIYTLHYRKSQREQKVSIATKNGISKYGYNIGKPRILLTAEELSRKLQLIGLQGSQPECIYLHNVGELSQEIFRAI